MGKLTYTPEGGSLLDLGQYAPGFESDIAGKWVKHTIPGLNGALQEDLADGTLGTTVQLQFVGIDKQGRNAQQQYDAIMGPMVKTRRGVLGHPRRGSRPSILARIQERMMWTTMGEATLVTLHFEDDARPNTVYIATPTAPNALGQQAIAQTQIADNAILQVRQKIFGLSKYNVAARQKINDAQKVVNGVTSEIRGYVNLALAFYGTAQDAFYFVATLPSTVTNQFAGLLAQLTTTTQNTVVSYQETANLLQGLPTRVQTACDALRNVNSNPADTQPTIAALELSLALSTQTDAAIRSNQPVMIEDEVTRSPGQNIYDFVQAKYARSNLTPAQKRSLVQSILIVNHNIRRPDLMPMGTKVLRPAL